ncbi:MAG: putative peptidoglycan glycosyltransferase FtsW [Candidatus Jorgensenbacteria bacterium]|nr:putative peptidoglycan glycosyltransferase FtsW [Candidatus Jorgensenbacteria bacterium]
MKIPTRTSAPDYVFIALLFVIVIFGLVMLSSASSDLGKTQYSNSYYFIEHQLFRGLSIGIVGFFVGVFLYYRRLERFSLPLLGLSIVLLLLVFTEFGSPAKGSERWLALGPITFQPGEILKLTFFVYLAAWMSKKYARHKNFLEGMVPFLIITGVIMAILFLQPSTTIAVLIFLAAAATYFMAGVPVRYLIFSGIAVAIAVGLLIAATPYRLARVKTFLNPKSADQLNEGYHINQALIAIGSGGLTGVGFGQSTTKLKFLPEPIGDSIFAVIAEELGFVGAMSFIIVFLLFLWRGFEIAKKAPDNFGRLLATGFMCVLGFQAFVNIAAISGILPLTGMPLPFVSYGGTALAVFLTMSGIVVNVSRYRR